MAQRPMWARLGGLSLLPIALAALLVGCSGDGQPEPTPTPTLVPTDTPIPTAAGTITTVAGGGSDLGDGGPATSAQLRRPIGIAVDGTGNVYIADNRDHRIRKVDTSGTITTVAGTGAGGFSGDGGPATSAQLRRPRGVALDGAGNLYIADSENNRIRKVDTSGTITTVAGGGSDLGDGGPATSAQLRRPIGVAVDGTGNLYIADTDSYRIRKVDTSGTITTVAGTGAGGFSGDGGPATNAQLSFPMGVALDGAGNVYIADNFNYRIRKVDTSGAITTVAGTGAGGLSGDGGDLGDGGPATRAELNQPTGVALDSAGNLYIADLANNRVWKVDTNGAITTVAGTGVEGFSGDGGLATSAELNGPQGVALDSAGNLYVADTGNQRIRKVAR